MKAASSSFIALLFAATFVAPAAATETMAPSYVSSNPEDGEMLDEAPERVEITFDEPLDESSSLKVSDECGRQVDDGNVDVEANMMSVGIALKPIGRYRVDYFSKGVGGLTGQESGTFGFMVHSGPSCGKKDAGGHGGGHGDNNGGGGQHNGGHSDGGGGNHGGGSGNHSGSGSGHQSSGTGHSSMGSSSTSGSYSSMNHAGSSSQHSSGSDGSGKHGSGKHGRGKHGGGKHGSGKHGGGAHGLLDILEENEEKEQRALAAGADGLPAAPDGQAVVMALALSLLMGVVGGWFLRVSGAR